MNYEGVLKGLRDLVLPPKEEVLQIIANARTHFIEETTTLIIDTPITVVGDLHGQFFDFLNMLEISDSSKGYLFLGDYVDRGYNSVELIIYLLVLKLLRPHKVWLLRGNHECLAQTAAYGFKEECLLKYDEIVYWKICNLFELLPLAAVVGNRYFCVHGGITPDTSLSALKAAERVREFPEMGEIMWGDPSEEVETFAESLRGAGFLFGWKAVEKILAKINEELGVTTVRTLVRSHQLVFEGLKEYFGGRCISVWSAPNYCYKCRNMAAVMEIDKTEHKYIYYKAVDEQYKEDRRC